MIWKALALLPTLLFATLSYSQFTTSDVRPNLRFDSLIVAYESLPDRLDEQGLAFLNGISSWAKLYGDSTQKLDVKLLWARYYIHRGMYHEALPQAAQVKNSMEATENQILRSSIKLRDAYFKLGAYQRALIVHKEINWSRYPDHWEGLVPEYFESMVHNEMGEYERGMPLIKKALRTLHEVGLPFRELGLLNNLGVYYERMGKLDSAWHYFNRANEVFRSSVELKPGEDSIHYYFNEGLLMGNLAQVLAKQGKHLIAIPLYKADIASSLNGVRKYEYLDNAVTSLLKLSVSYMETKQLPLAKKSLDEAWSVLRQLGRNDNNLEYWKLKWDYYDAIESSDSAMMAAKRYMHIDDSLDQILEEQVRTNLHIAYESGLEESVLTKQQQEMERLKARADRERLVRNAVLILIAVLMMVIFYIFRAYRERLIKERELAEKTRKIEEQTALIEKSLKEKEVLLREVHHRVKNNLQIISSLFFLQSKKLEDSAAKSVLQEGQARVHVMSLIHQKLYQSEQLETVDLQSYITDLAQQIMQSNRSSDVHIDLSINANHIEQHVDQAIPLGLIMNELITNSIKHGFVGRKIGHISIEMKKRQNLYRLVYEDDGRGMATLQELENEGSLGMKLIRLLTNQLNGAIEFDASDGFKITIEYEAEG